jgi:hypothetical protein
LQYLVVVVFSDEGEEVEQCSSEELGLKVEQSLYLQQLLPAGTNR